ncbi:hypothetical protein [Pseudomonas sp. S2_H01]
MSDPLKLLKPSVDASRLRFKGTLSVARGDLVVCWQGGLTKNPTPNTVPLTDVLFRTLHEDGKLGAYHIIPAAISHLGSLRHGTVWREGRLVGHLKMQTLPETKVDFDRGGWRCIDARAAGLQDQYRLGITAKLLDSKLIELFVADGKSILTPCLEFFTRCYGRSSETSRLIATHGLEELRRQYFYEFDPAPNELILKLERGVANREAPFLAHAMYDDYTKARCNSLHQRLKAGFVPGEPTFLLVKPWFLGPASIEGQGYWINEHTFLLLNIDGLSDPLGPPIIVEREHFSGDEAPPDGQYNKRHQPPQPSNDEIDLTDDEAPDSNTARVLYTPPFKRLGIKRELIRKTRVTPGRPSIPVDGHDRNSYAPGDGYGGGRGGGKGEYVSSDWMAEGTLAQLWQTCLRLEENHPDRISEVGWYTLKKGFQTEGIPEYQFLSAAATQDPT